MENTITKPVTITQVMEYLFCPRFIYFMECLQIPQREGLRFKVKKGRELHEQKSRINKDYLRKKIGCIDKKNNIYLSSDKYRVRGILDEIVWLDDGTAAPLEYKFAEYKERIFMTQRIQLVLQAAMIMENYGIEVNRGYIVFIRSKNYMKRINLADKDFDDVIKIIDRVLYIIENGYYPKRTESKRKCIDCCYKNICV